MCVWLLPCASCCLRNAHQGGEKRCIRTNFSNFAISYLNLNGSPQKLWVDCSKVLLQLSMYATAQTAITRLIYAHNSSA